MPVTNTTLLTKTMTPHTQLNLNISIHLTQGYTSLLRRWLTLQYLWCFLL